jgi:hypothetical protein
MSKEKNESKTVQDAPAVPEVKMPVKQFKVTVDGASHVYEANNAVEAWAMHNDQNKTAHSMKQKSPVIEEVK